MKYLKLYISQNIYNIKIILGCRCNIWIYGEMKMVELKHQGQESLKSKVFDAQMPLIL